MKITAFQGPYQKPIPERISIKITATPSFDGKKIYRIERFISSNNEPVYFLDINDHSYTKPCRKQHTLDSQAAETAIKILLNTPLYVCNDEGVGLDGTFYLLEISIGMQQNMRFSWWEDLPQEWKGLSEVLKLAGLLT